MRQVVRSELSTLSESVRLALWLQTDDAIEAEFDGPAPGEYHSAADAVDSDCVVAYVIQEFLHPLADEWSNRRLRQYLGTEDF